MYKPLPDNVTIKNSPIEGLGLFATQFIPSNTEIGITHIYDEEFEDGVIRLPLGGFYNHSENSNCISVDGEINGKKCKKLISKVDINEGDEITSTYTLYTII